MADDKLFAYRASTSRAARAGTDARAGYFAGYSGRVTLRPLTVAVKDGFAQLHADTDPSSIEPAIAAARRSLRLQFNEPLPASVLAATSEVLARHPDVVFRAYGRSVEPGLDWLSGFEHIEHLVIHLWQETSFDALSGFTQLRSLSLGATASKRPSLAFLRQLLRLEVLTVEAHDKDFDAIGEVASLRRLQLRTPRAKSLEPLRGHKGIAVLSVDFGGIRDLGPVASLPHLRGLQLYQVRKLDTDDLDALGDCVALEALSLGALRNVRSLRALTREPSETLRFLTLERLTELTTLGDLAMCGRLEQLGLYESRPADKRLDVLLACPSLRRVVVGDVYPRAQVDALRTRFTGGALRYRGESSRDDFGDIVVRWRRPVHTYLDGAV